MKDPLPVKRISLESIVADILAVLNLEKGIFYTLRELALRPGTAIQHYLYTEKRSLFIKPLNFLLLVIGLVVFVTYRLTKDLLNNERIAADMVGKIPEYWQPIFMTAIKLNQDYSTAMKLLSLPLLALFTFWFFRKKGFNYAEHLVINAYVISFQGLLTLLVLPIALWNSTLGGLLAALAFGYFFYAYFYIFQVKKLQGLLKILGVVIFSLMASSITSILIAQVYSWYY